MTDTIEQIDFETLAARLPREVVDGTTMSYPKCCGASRRADESRAAKQVSAWALMYEGEQAGRIVWSVGDAGGWTCSVYVFAGPMGCLPVMTGRATGYGYCKRSASFESALSSARIPHQSIAGRGERAVMTWLKTLGYTVLVAL